MAQFTSFQSREVHDGIQYRKFFPNGYGISIVKHSFSYGGNEGLWEAAILRGDMEDYVLDYDTPITGDVLGYLTEEEVDKLVADVEKLQPQPVK